MNWIVTPMLGPGEKPVALAHSMGAHNLLRALARRPDSFAAAVLSAPMIAISFRGQRELLVRAVTALPAVARQARATGCGAWKRAIPTGSVSPPSWSPRIPQRFERTQMLLREQPDLRLAGATWGWLAAALRSMDWLTRPGGPKPSPRRCWWSARARTASA